MPALKKAVRHGLVMKRIIAHLKRVGLDINAYYLIREGVRFDSIVSPAMDKKYSSDLIAEGDLAQIDASTNWVTESKLRDRLEKGHMCVVLKHGGVVAGYTWADLEEVNDVSCDYVLQEGEAYLYNAFVSPDYRGCGLAPQLRYECYKYLREAGIDTFYSLSSYFDTPSVRFKEKLNAEIIRLYLRVKVGKHNIGQWILKEYS